MTEGGINTVTVLIQLLIYQLFDINCISLTLTVDE